MLECECQERNEHMHPHKESDYIPSDLYDQITKCMPIVSVEAVIVMDESLLFLKRNNQPAKGEWWFPGGRIRKGESLEEALRREVKEETGLDVSSYRHINVYSRVFPERHDVVAVYLCKCKKGKVKLNNEHSEYALFRILPSGFHKYLVETIRDSQWENYREATSEKIQKLTKNKTQKKIK
jgi:colanic acid biosynthesis protein WcaH